VARGATCLTIEKRFAAPGSSDVVTSLAAAISVLVPLRGTRLRQPRATLVEIETEKRETPKVVNIMDALKKSMQARGQTKVKDSVRKRMGKAAPKDRVAPASPRSRTTRRTAH
jgi:hypothetical protein